MKAVQLTAPKHSKASSGSASFCSAKAERSLRSSPLRCRLAVAAPQPWREAAAAAAAQAAALAGGGEWLPRPRPGPGHRDGAPSSHGYGLRTMGEQR